MTSWWIVLGIWPVLEALCESNQNCGIVCTCDLFIADCKGADLTDIPPGIDYNVTSMDLSCNNFKNVPKTLTAFTNLKYLNLSHNTISTLGHTDFIGMRNLEMLDLTFNQFHDWKDIHSQAFTPLFKLTFLDFSNNPLRSLPQYSSHLLIRSMEILRLNNCSMVMLPVNVFSQMNKIKELHASKNPIRVINGSMRSSTIKYIDLSRCKLEYVADTVFTELTALETLMMNNNRFLRNLTINSDSLRFLDLSGSNMETIPSGNLRAVTALNLQENFLKGLEGSIFKNYLNLITLNLSMNALSKIAPSSFKGLDNLQLLDLSHNKLSILSERVLLPTTSLLELNLSHNYIHSIDSLTSSSLKALDMSYCEISEISKDSLMNLPKLTWLSLARNYINALPDGWTADRLHFLDISYCRIKSINNKTFQQMSRLRQINLSGNRLTTIDPKNFPNVLYVNLEDNQWRCDCPKLKDMFEWMAETTTGTDSLVCDSPETYEGLTWEQSCFKEWYPVINKKSQLWWYSVVVIVAMLILLIIVAALKRMNTLKEERLRQMEEQRRSHEREAREALQRMQRAQREFIEEADRNAPDPRELQRPPSYDEALLLPRLDLSHMSLNESLHSITSRPSLHGSNPEITRKNKVRRKRRRRKSEESRESRRQSRASGDETASEPERVAQPLQSDL